jgi:hypothetical protein
MQDAFHFGGEDGAIDRVGANTIKGATRCVIMLKTMNSCL